MTDAVVIVSGLLLAVLAIPDVFDALWVRRVQRLYPSVAIDIQKRYIDVIAGVGIGFAIIGLNSALTRLAPEFPLLLPSGAGLVILLVIAFVLKWPGARLRAQVKRLVATARAEEAYHTAPILPADES